MNKILTPIDEFTALTKETIVYHSTIQDESIIIDLPGDLSGSMHNYYRLQVMKPSPGKIILGNKWFSLRRGLIQDACSVVAYE